MRWNKLLLLLALTAGIALEAHAQYLETGLKAYPVIAHSQGMEWGMNGTGVELTYLHRLESEVLLKGGFEAALCGWGSQLLVPLGCRLGGQHDLEGSLINGIALYQQAPAWVGGLELSYVLSFLSAKKNALVLSAGLRFIIQPAYKEYSPLYYYLELPLRISWSRKLRKTELQP